MKEELVFFERQHVKRWIAIVLTIAIFAPIIVFITLILSDKSENNLLFIVPAVFAALIMFVITVLLFFMRLDTIINKEGVFYRMFPFHSRFKLIAWNYIKELEVRKFNILIGPHGFGMRYGGFSFAGLGMSSGIGFSSYTLSGNRVLQLLLYDNKKVYIGTQRADELVDFLIKLDAERKQK